MKKTMILLLAVVTFISMMVLAKYSAGKNFQFYRCNPRCYVKFIGDDTPEKRKKAYEKYGCKADMVMDDVVDTKESGIVSIIVGTIN